MTQIISHSHKLYTYSKQIYIYIFWVVFCLIITYWNKCIIIYRRIDCNKCNTDQLSFYRYFHLDDSTQLTTVNKLFAFKHIGNVYSHVFTIIITHCHLLYENIPELSGETKAHANFSVFPQAQLGSVWGG